MKVVFAQGNPEKKYDATRHNVGFLVADSLAARHSTAFQDKPKFAAALAECSINGEKVLIAKPTTYYNETGRSLRAIIDFYKLSPEDIVVVHDELALGFGTIRARHGGSDAGNNGIKSINQHGGEDTSRLRIGVSNELRARQGDVDFVLSNFSKDEQKSLKDSIIPKALELIDTFVAGDHQATSHTFFE